ncbi:conserved hypothetical protein [Beutenbergia cavernae DSM 12333]|uniref:DUF3093 domain-containing protein n=1 Tax=Beutenbergia cavernae (strain ATCC BAA-8 / DSM 12333 / CCUG 43141 / JCM 11478 / NBRC 16432 / NCIMB 13614 / HKI 0122) TaxID=471853 RepID=C5C5K1_BEUC1|nr:DUF3093 domain-containing protein [Beutenbergia cavernae]ACQ80192.1 conserved hypothetical protein [Beutenbergia cavernae DSM 12333]
MSVPRPAVLPPPVHVERLWPSPGFWALGPGAGLFAGLALTPVGQGVALSAGFAVCLLVLGLLGAGSPTLAVVGGARPGVRAGRAFLPVEHIGAVDALDEAQTRDVLGPGADARAFAVHRGWIRRSVRIAVVDPRDPAPYWLLSSRDPQALADAVRALPRRPDGHDGQAAHSEHTS